MLIEIFVFIILIFSIIIHEIAHGSMAYVLGDPTAKDAGRLTLNPLSHIDLFGSIILPFFLFIVTAGKGPIFGWAKPVPVNPYNFRDQKWGEFKVAFAGPATNFLIAIIFGLVIRFLVLPNSILVSFGIITIYNLLLGIFNLIPIPPLDGFHVLFNILSDRFNNFKFFMRQYGLVIFLIFIFFGLNFVYFLVELLFYFVTGKPISNILI